MKVFELHNQPVEADTYEASMALNQLLKIGKHAIKIHNMIDDSAEMEAWVAKKIDLAGDYVKKVHGYMQGEKAGLYDDGGMTEEKTPQEKLAIMSKIEKIKKQSRDLTNNKDRDLINRNKELLAKLVKQLHEGMGEKIANMAQNMSKDEFMSHADELGLTPEEAAEHYEKMSGGAHAGKFEDAGEQALANDIGLFFVKKAKEMLQSMERPNKNDQEYEEYVDIAQAFKKGIQAGLDEVNMSNFEFSNNPFGDFGRGIDDGPDEELVKILAKHGYQPGPDGANDKATIVKQRDESVSEDAGEGHMSKSTLYHTAKYAIELTDMIDKGDDLEGWVQSKLNKAADYLQGVHNYEEYQKLNPYREELDSKILQRHAGIVQKHIDEILAKETTIDDVDTKPGMMRILAKRVNEVEKEIAKEQRKDTDEEAPPGREKQVKALKKKFKDKGAPYAIAWAQHNKHGKPKKEAEINEGIKDWAKNLAMAGVIVAGLAGVGSIQDAIDRSVPAVQAMETALELAQDQGNDELANMIKKDLSAVKVRLTSGKDLNFVKDMQSKYSKFIQTEGLAYESKLAIMLNQQLK